VTKAPCHHQPLLQKEHHRVPFLDTAHYIVAVGRCAPADERHESWTPSRVQVGSLPVHPFFNIGAGEG
jgi:hypothetical protein